MTKKAEPLRVLVAILTGTERVRQQEIDRPECGGSPLGTGSVPGQHQRFRKFH